MAPQIGAVTTATPAHSAASNPIDATSMPIER